MKDLVTAEELINIIKKDKEDNIKSSEMKEKLRKEQISKSDYVTKIGNFYRKIGYELIDEMVKNHITANIKKGLRPKGYNVYDYGYMDLKSIREYIIEPFIKAGYEVKLDFPWADFSSVHDGYIQITVISVKLN